jgi:hypothetical protein
VSDIKEGNVVVIVISLVGCEIESIPDNRGQNVVC